MLDPNILTIGFARRFATYKRAALLFTDIDRLRAPVWDQDRPVQIVFAGKAHPADRPGQGVIQEIFGRSRSPKLRGRVFILEDYDMRIARFLVQGVDVWLNNPRRPLEASGTSGMKAAANGVVNVSVLDGWWDEGWTGDNGWAIGGRETNPDEGAQDWADAQDLYRILEQEIDPRLLRARRARPPLAVGPADAQLDCQHDLALLDHPHAPRVRGAALPAGRLRGRQRACPFLKQRRTAATKSNEDRSVAPRISLALAIHNHQPVGNFGWVFAEVYDRAYLPMLEALERHPGVRLSLHYTGPLLEWLAAERPEFLARLGSLVARRQVELLGGGLYEPILASLPERDRVDQLTRMAATLESITGHRPQGAWLAERVWEPDLPTSLVKAGYRWTILDDQHFRAASIPEENLWGAYTTEDQGNLLTVFGTEQGLRYRIPFGRVEDVIDYLRDHATEAGDRVGMMGDDGEKFGAWPTTFEHCWGGGRWVEQFFEALEASSDWLSTVTPSAWLEREPPIGRVYVPTSSYAEMGEWALPPDESVVFTGLLHDAVARHEPQARWLRGGFWRNFQVKYREINDLHKQMLRASAKVGAMADGPAKTAALDHLHRGQSNDCYWHGLFGGIYISHMRLATCEHLIAAEDAADAALGSERGAVLMDLDMDGRDEVLLSEPGQVVAVKPSEGAGIGQWDIRAARHALGSALRRRPEAYHETLRRHDASGPQAAPTADGGVVSAHDLVMVKEEGLAARLCYDDHERRSGLLRFLEPDVSPAAVAIAAERELGDFRDGEWQVDHLAPGQVSLSRNGTVLGPAPWRREDDPPGRRADGPGADPGARDPPQRHRGHRHTAGGRAVAAPAGRRRQSFRLVRRPRQPQRARRVRAGGRCRDQSRYGNDWVGVAVEARPEPAADAWWSPIETISNSESGFERVYQGSALLFSWPVRLAPGETRRFSVTQRVNVARDRALEEAGAAAS